MAKGKNRPYQTKVTEEPTGNYIVSTGNKSPDDIKELPMGWNISRMDQGGKFKCDLRRLHGYAKKLQGFERKNKREIEGMQHCHPMSIGKISAEAKRRVTELNIEEETLFQLDIGTPARLWGVWELNIFHVIWLDEKHSVYKTQNKK